MTGTTTAGPATHATAIATMIAAAGAAATMTSAGRIGGTKELDPPGPRAKSVICQDILPFTDIGVTTEDSVVALSGSVKTRSERVRAAEVARKVEGVKRVKNDLKVQ